MNLSEIPSPALIVDSAMLRANIDLMATAVRSSHKRLRPHFKAHKCLNIAQLQIEAGAAGICAATESEARLLVHAGIHNVLLTSPIGDMGRARRLSELGRRDATFTVVVDNATQVEMFEACGIPMNVIVDIDVGDHRTGVVPPLAADLVKLIVNSPLLRFSGLQGYSVRASHTEENRRAAVSAEALNAVELTRKSLEAEGIEVPLTTGASTATYSVDAAGSALDEIQAGSYVYMDLAYRKLGGLPFQNAATVLATVISANQSDRVTVDAGFKAFSTDRPFGPEAFHNEHLRYEWAGDEFGYVFLDRSRTSLKAGDRIRFLPPHCDPTANLHERVWVHNGEDVVDIWPIMDRKPSTEAKLPAIL